MTDFIVLHEHRGVPTGMTVCHLPFGPTAYFQLANVVMRHDIPDVGKMSEQYPHLMFNNFTSRLGQRVSCGVEITRKRAFICADERHLALFVPGAEGGEQAGDHLFEQ